MNISIGIATAGRPEQLASTLHQLANQTVAPYRVLVCPATPWLPYLGAQITRVSGPLGLCAQRNAFLAKALDCDVGKRTVRSAGVQINRY